MKYKYGKKSFIKTNALKKYRNENGLNNVQLAEKIGENLKFVSNCISRGSVPKEVLQKLGIKARNAAVRSNKSTFPERGTIYASCYVGGDQQPAFLAFCSALGINAKDMV